MKSFRLLSACAALVLVAACGETPDDPVDGSYRFIHAAANESSVGFQLEQVSAGTLDYAFGNAAAPLDSGPFDFAVNALSPTDSGSLRAVDLAVDIQANNDHIFILYDDTGSLELVNYVVPTPESGGTNAGVRFLHAAAGAANVDLYVEADGADLSAATPRSGDIAYRTLSDEVDIAAGTYLISATAVGDPTSVLFQSGEFTLADGDAIVMGVFLGAGTSNAPLRVSVLNRANSSPQVLPDALTPPDLRVINAALTGGDVDVVIDSDFTTPFQAAVMPGEIRDYAPTPTTEIKINVTPAGNMGVLEVDQDITLSAGTSQTQVISGAPGDYSSAIYADDNRGVRARASYRIRNASAEVDFIDVYLEEPGTDLTDETPLQFGLTSASTELAAVALPGDYEITLILNDADASTDDTTVVGGPFAITLNEQTVYDIVIIDSAVVGEVELLISEF